MHSVISSSDLSERGNPRLGLLRSFHSLAIFSFFLHYLLRARRYTLFYNFHTNIQRLYRMGKGTNRD